MALIIPHSIVSILLRNVVVLFLVVRRRTMRVKCPCPAWGWEGVKTTPRQPTRRGAPLPSRAVP